MIDLGDVGSINVLIYDCDLAIAKQGARARVAFTVLGKWGKRTLARLYAGGPQGQIVAHTNDGNKLIVMFRATEVKIKLEELKNGITTTANRN